MDTFKEDICQDMFNDPEYVAEMQRLQDLDFELMGELWGEENE